MSSHFGVTLEFPYERKSVMITTNLVFSEWNRIFKDPMTTLAAIDRVVHHSVILDMMGVDSYRVQEANQEHALPAEERREDSKGSTASAKVMRIQSTI